MGELGEFWGKKILWIFSQLKRLSRLLPFFSKKGFSSLALLFFGVTGTLSMSPAPESQTESQTLPDSSEASSASLSADPGELCRWQRDFSFFNELLGGDEVMGDQAPCPEKVPEQEGQEGTDSHVSQAALPQTTELSTAIAEMTAGYPIAVMAPAIAEYDRAVAALIVGIAKKESNWGKRVPRDAAGDDCFNYWGFKGAGTRGVAMGHGCFGSPEEAVQAIGNRLTDLVAKRKGSEPKNMIIWKCGSSCATHSPESVSKWIADVDLYYRQIVQD